MWKKESDVAVRVGPLELIKNGILILRTQTNSRGKLHGQFMSWSDEGELLEKGIYIEGLKEGIWIVMRKDGNSEKVYYKKGAPIEP